MAVDVALNFILGAGLWFLGFRMLFVEDSQGRLPGLAVISAGTLLATSGLMMITEWGQ